MHETGNLSGFYIDEIRQAIGYGGESMTVPEIVSFIQQMRERNYELSRDLATANRNMEVIQQREAVAHKRLKRLSDANLYLLEAIVELRAER